MRWFVEVSRVGDSTPAERYCVEAKAWQAALQETRKLRGDTGPLSKFSIELLDDGYRAVDPIQKIRYLVNQAPSDAPIALPVNGAAHASKPPSGGHSAPPPSPSVAPHVGPSVAPAPAVPAGSAASSPPLAAVVGAASAAPAGVSVAPTAPLAGTPITASAPPAVAGAIPSIPALASGGLAVALAATAPAGAKASVSAVPRPVSRRPQSPHSADKTPRPPDVAPIESAAAKGSAAPAAAPVAVAPVAVIAPSGAPKAAASASVPASAAASSAAELARSAAPKAPVKTIGNESALRAATPSVAKAPRSPVSAEAPSNAVAIPEHRVFMSRSQEPKPDAPITYREQACVVAPGTPREAVEALLRERWQSVKKEIATHPSGQLVQIAVFDHVFEQRPQRSPLGTLAWKDWRGDPVLGFPGFGVPSPPVTKSVPPPAPTPDSNPPAVEEAKAPASAQESAEGPREAPAAVAVPPAVEPVPVAAVAPAEAIVAAAPAPAPAVAAVSAVVVESEVAAPAVASRPVVRGRRRAGEDLISELFEAMHELHFARDIVTGTEFVLGVLADVIPCEYALISVFNINTRKFVVVRAQGPGAQGSILHATPDNDASVVEVMRRGGARAFKAIGDARFTGGRFASFKYPVEQLLCGPVRQGGRYLGLIEIANPLGGKPFHDSEINALDYICEQFADFVASRPVVLDPDVILAR